MGFTITARGPLTLMLNLIMATMVMGMVMDTATVIPWLIMDTDTMVIIMARDPLRLNPIMDTDTPSLTTDMVIMVIITVTVTMVIMDTVMASKTAKTFTIHYLFVLCKSF